MATRVLSTNRTNIEVVEPNDASFFLELYQTPEWIRFIGKRDLTNVDEVRTYLSNGLIKLFTDKGYGYYLVRLKDGTPIGTCGFMKKPNLEYEDFGFAYLPRYHGQGYAYEAGKVILELGVHEFGIHPVDAVTVEDNTASIKLLKKLGFEKIGESKDDQTGVPLELYRYQL